MLDGFPRPLDQANALDQLLSELHMELNYVVELLVDEDIIVARIRKRGEAGSGCSDDTEEMARKRMQVYRAQTEPVSAYYRAKKMLQTVDGLGEIEEVMTRILALL